MKPVSRAPYQVNRKAKCFRFSGHTGNCFSFIWELLESLKCFCALILTKGLDSSRQVKSLRKTTTVLIFKDMFRQLFYHLQFLPCCCSPRFFPVPLSRTRHNSHPDFAFVWHEVIGVAYLSLLLSRFLKNTSLLSHIRPTKCSMSRAGFSQCSR